MPRQAGSRRSCQTLDSMRNVVPIEEIEINTIVGILVRPRIPLAENYEHIYRTASGVRWHPQSRALVAYDVDGMPPEWWFRQIVAAVAGEYGQVLELRPDTRWKNVSELERKAIESAHEKAAV